MTYIKTSIVLALFAAPFSWVAQQANAQGREPGNAREARGAVKSVAAGSITLTSGGGRDTPPIEKTYAVAKNVEVCVAAGGGLRIGGFFKEVKLTELAPGTTVTLSLTADLKTAEAIIADEPTVRGVLKTLDAKSRTLTISTGQGREMADEEATFAFPAEVDVAVDDGRGRRFSIHEGKIDDLAPGAILTMRLSLDKKQIRSIMAEGSLVSGVVKSVDAKKFTMTLTVRPARGDEAAEERVLAIAKEAQLLNDDGKGRRLSVKEVKLDEVAVGSSVFAKLSVDQGFVMLLKAEGPTLIGLLKAVDADKRTITIGIPKNRDEFDEKVLTLAKDARINIDGADAKLADLKVGDNGPFLQLRLTLDQKTVQSVVARQPGAR